MLQIRSKESNPSNLVRHVRFHHYYSSVRRGTKIDTPVTRGKFHDLVRNSLISLGQCPNSNTQPDLHCRSQTANRNSSRSTVQSPKESVRELCLSNTKN